MSMSPFSTWSRRLVASGISLKITRFTFGTKRKWLGLASKMVVSPRSHLRRMKGPEPAEFKPSQAAPKSPSGNLSVLAT
jgi:hypothetical protein